MEKVSVLEGTIPALIIAPHGFKNDDLNTDLIAEEIATDLSAYAVINRGWERADKVDWFNDKADCNNSTDWPKKLKNSSPIFKLFLVVAKVNFPPR